MKKVLLALAIYFFALPALADDKAYILLEGVKPKGAPDGDTYTVDLRFQGIDTPEKAQLCEKADGTCYECGQEAKKALMSLITYKEGNRTKKHGLQMRIWTVGKYGRPVVTAYLNGKDLHEEMLRQGWAVAYRQYLPAPLKRAYIAAETEAKEAKRGIWQGNFIVPSQWRRSRNNRLQCEQ
jgi:endonuclease YncB( thermonuclease family)